MRCSLLLLCFLVKKYDLERKIAAADTIPGHPACLETGTMPKRGPAHPGLNSIDPFGALVVICCTIIFAAWLFHDTPVQHVVAAVVAFYAVFALAVAIVCRNGKVSQS